MATNRLNPASFWGTVYHLGGQFISPEGRSIHMHLVSVQCEKPSLHIRILFPRAHVTWHNTNWSHHPNRACGLARYMSETGKPFTKHNCRTMQVQWTITLPFIPKLKGNTTSIETPHLFVSQRDYIVLCVHVPPPHTAFSIEEVFPRAYLALFLGHPGLN